MGDFFDVMDTSEIPEDKSINILIIGETGVGKSTFINAFGNYLNFDSLDDVEAGKFFVFIPTKFTVTDENYELKVVKIGSDKNEHNDLGQSSTQDPRTYTFPLSGGEKFVNLIDTPGIGDTRGIDQDTINCEKILNYIAPLKVIHGICFLLKPNSTKITVLFEFCMKQILSRLEKSASKNLLFVFTNTRGTCYRPGETLPCLRQVLEDIQKRPPHVEIPLSKKNIFCLDNEAFRYLAAVQNGVKFTERERQYFVESWVKSTEDSWRMIFYIMGDSENEGLVPHQVEDTMCINEARNLINQLKQPMADITQLIHDKLRVLQRHQDILKHEKLTIEDLKKNLVIPIVDIEVIELPQPVTVCTSAKCAKIYKVRDVEKWHYKQRCHNPCYLENVPKEMIGAPELTGCLAMDGHNKCRICGCDYSTHMHIYYESNTVDKTIENDNVKDSIISKEKILEEKNKVVNDINIMMDELEQEHKQIIKYTAKFAQFLQQNAITPYNDVYKAYIEYLIDREKSLGEDANGDTIKYYQTLQNEYEEAKKAFDNALTFINQSGEHKGLNSPEEIKNSVEELFGLKHTGKRIKELYTAQHNTKKQERKQHTLVLDPGKLQTENHGKTSWLNGLISRFTTGNRPEESSSGAQNRSVEKGKKDTTEGSVQVWKDPKLGKQRQRRIKNKSNNSLVEKKNERLEQIQKASEEAAAVLAALTVNVN